MKAFSFLSGSKRSPQRQGPSDLQIIQTLHDDDSDFNIYEPVPTPSSTRSFNSGSLSFTPKNRSTISSRKPRRSNDALNGGDTTPTQESKLRSPMYTRFGFSKSSSQLPSPPLTSIPSPLRSGSALSSNSGSFSSPSTLSVDVTPKNRPVHLAPVAPPLDVGSATLKGYTLGALGLRRATVSKGRSNPYPEKGLTAPSTDPDASSTSNLLQRRRAKSLGTQAGAEAGIAIKIPPALRLPPRLPPEFRPDVTQSPSFDTPTKQPLLTPNSVPLEQTTSSASVSPLGNAIVGMGLAVPLSLPQPSTGSPRSSDIRRLRSESNSSRTNSDSNSSRARSESASSAASSSRQGHLSSSASSRNSTLSSSAVFSPHRTSYKPKSRNTSNMSVGSGVGVGLKLDDICDGFLKDIDEDAQESGSELLFMTEKSSPRKRGIAQVQKQRSFEKFLSPQESKAAHKAPSLPSTIASAPPTILTFGTTRSRAQSFGNAQAPVRLPQSISTTESDSGSSMYSALSQMTPTKNSRSLRRQDVPMLSFDRQRAVMTPSSGEKCAQLVASVSGASLSSLPYLRSPEFAHEVGVAACDKHEPLLPSQPSSQTFPTLESDDLIHYPVRNPPPEIDTVSDLPVIPPKEAHFVSQPPFAHSQHQDPRASIWSVTSTNSQFSQFSLSLFPSPPSVPIVRPTTDKGTFPSSMSEAEGLVVPETENGQNTLPYRFKSIVPSRRTPRLQRMLLTDDLSTLSSHSRSNSNSSYPLTVGESSQQPGSPRTESPLPPPNYAALLRSMEAPGPLDTSGTGVYVGHPEEKTPSAFGNYGLGYTRGLPNIVSEENARPGSANSRLQWGYAL